MATMPQNRLRVVEAQNYKRMRRKHRRPSHPFNTSSKPFEITPNFFAPVLPGETLQNLLYQSRVVTDPIKNSLTGWHQECYWFYVPLPALSDWDTGGLLQSMMVDPTTDVSALKATADDSAFYAYQGGMDFTKAITELITKEFFRDEDESLGSVLETLYPAQMDFTGPWQSMKFETDGQDDAELPGVDDLEELDILPSFTAEYAQWEMMRDHGVIDMDYDDYIRSYGVSVPKAEEIENPEETKFRPEVIRYFRKWQYPSNTVDPADGTVASAVSWSIKERADKKRFFKYPGFVCGFSLTRPKLYLGTQVGAAIGFLDNAYSWLPSVLHGHVYSSIKEIEDNATEGPFQNMAEDYWFDCKDLFLHGDQFVSPRVLDAARNIIGQPGGGSVGASPSRYPSLANIDSLFSTAGTDFVRQDGMASLDILGKLSETTP